MSYAKAEKAQKKAPIEERVVPYCAMSTRSPHLRHCLGLKGKKEEKA